MKRKKNLFPSITTNDFNRFDMPLIESWLNDLFETDNIQTSSMNVIETDEDFLFEVLAPNFDKSDFNIEIIDNKLEIIGKCSNKNDDNNGKYIRQEFTYSSFKRTFNLPKNIIQEKISAKYDNGILHIKIPKSNSIKSKNKKIEIK